MSFSEFAWAFGKVDTPTTFFLPMKLLRPDVEKSSIYAQEFDFTEVEIAWVELKSNQPVILISSTCWKYNSIDFRKFWEGFAHANQCHLHVFKKCVKILNSNCQGIEKNTAEVLVKHNFV